METNSTQEKKVVLVLEQHSEAERFSVAGTERAQCMHCMYDKPIYRTWDEMAAAFPSCVKEVSVNARPSYGSSHWVRGEDGRIVISTENWDSGD